MAVSLCFYTDTDRYFFLKLNVRTFDERQKERVHHFNNVQSEKKKRKKKQTGRERDLNPRLLHAFPCTSPLSHQPIQRFLHFNVNMQ